MIRITIIYTSSPERNEAHWDVDETKEHIKFIVMVPKCYYI
jgi:hypothetical protein